MHKVLLLLFIIAFQHTYAQDTRSEILYQISYREIKGNKLFCTDSISMQINSRMGEHDAKISIPYTKGDKLTIEDVFILDMDNNIVRKLKKNEFTDQSAISDYSLYEDSFVKYFEPKHSTYPYRISYSYKREMNNPISIANIDLVGVSTPIRYGKLVVKASNENPIKYQNKNTSDPIIETFDKSTIYTWEYSHEKQPKEKNMSYNSESATEIIVLPLKFKFGVEGNYDSWASFGNWLYALNDERDFLPESEKQKINSLIQGINDDKTKAKILYKYLQENTRYINVSMKLGGLQTHPAEYVSINKYGDCKALTNYMKAMLKHVGIKSYTTAIRSSYNVRDLDPTFPNADEFNHVILSIPFDSDTTYLECTSKNNPFGYIGTSTQGRQALLYDSENSRLINIPQLSDAEVLCKRTIKVDRGPISSKVFVEIEAEQRGEQYKLSSALMFSVKKDFVEKYIKNYILSGSFELVDFNISKPDENAAVSAMNIKCEMTNMYKHYGNNYILTNFPIETETYELPEKRTHDLQIDYPINITDSIIYGFLDQEINKIPENINLTTEFGSYNVEFILEDNKLIVIKNMNIKSGRYPVSNYEKFYEFISTIKNNESRNIYIETI